MVQFVGVLMLKKVNISKTQKAHDGQTHQQQAGSLHHLMVITGINHIELQLCFLLGAIHKKISTNEHKCNPYLYTLSLMYLTLG
jgi:hypothetical protein